MKTVQSIGTKSLVWCLRLWQMCVTSLFSWPVTLRVNHSVAPLLASSSASSIASPSVSSIDPPSERLSDPLSARLEAYLSARYQFRFNLLSELPEYRTGDSSYMQVTQRMCNTLCLEAQGAGIACWDKDVVRYLHSHRIADYHPFLLYMEQLPAWDGVDRVTPLACRISSNSLWVASFRRWLLGMSAQWMGMEGQCANAIAPMLISSQQGWGKSTFCRLLMPESLKPYYTDSFELTGQAGCEQKLAYFGLINLDEFDRLSAKRLPLLKNLMQMHAINFRKAHRASYSHMPRMASFIGTSNQRELLADPTGSRRYLCMELSAPIDATPLAHKQLFAQLKSLLLAGERSWLSSEEEAAWQLNNRPYYRGLSLESLFFSRYRLADADEESMEHSLQSIFKLLSKEYPVAMGQVKAVALGRQLTKWGVERVHTKLGNLYRVVVLEKSGR
ncbi:MAG: VapE domain-containing protein [Phocaeicola sp.]